MVFQGKIDAKSKAFARFLREESGITVKEITKRCNVSRASVYRCLQNEEIDRETTEDHASRAENN